MRVSQVAVLVESGAVSVVVSISGMCALRGTTNNTAFWVGYLGACLARYRDCGVRAPSSPFGHGKRKGAQCQKPFGLPSEGTV